MSYRSNTNVRQVFGSERCIHEQVRDYFQSIFHGLLQAPHLYRLLYSVLLGGSNALPGQHILARRTQGIDIIRVRFSQAIATNELYPAQDLSTSMMVECLLGQLNQWVVETLEQVDRLLQKGEDAAIGQLRIRTSATMLDHHVSFYLRGLGHLSCQHA